MTAPYIAQRDAILAHAAAAAAAVNAQWRDVAIGAPIPRGNRCVRVFYGGEAQPRRMGGPRVLNAELVAETVQLVAFWTMPTLDESIAKSIDDEMVAFKHELRTRILGDSQLGGASTDLEMSYAEPDYQVIGGARWAILGVEFVTDYTEYALAP
jgi:hypothetical protein